MFDNYIIEIRSSPDGDSVRAGIVVRHRWGFRFFAATAEFDPLDGELFDSPKAAQIAALRQVTEITFGQVHGAPTLPDRDDAQSSRKMLIGADL